jgi:hypothetical protein
MDRDFVHMDTSDLVFLINKKSKFFSFIFFLKKLHIDNNVSHKCVKYPFQILYILNYTK